MMINKIEKYSHVKLLMLLILIGYVFLILGSGIIPLTDPDEVFYALTTKEMVAKNEWMTPHIFGLPQFEKPIFCYWLWASTNNMFGDTAFWYRFWPGLFAVFGLTLVYALTWVLFRSKLISFLSGVVLCSSFIYFALARAVLTDMIFSVLVVASIASFGIAYFGNKNKDCWLALFWVFSGIAVLAKGLLGIIFPVTTVFVFLFYKKNIDFIKSAGSFWGGVLFLAIILPWHMYMFDHHGDAFWKEYFINDHIRRVLEAEHLKADTWYFYPSVMIFGLMPWSYYVLFSVREFWKGIKRKSNEADRFIFIFIWIASVFVYVQIAHSKLASYVFPAIPAIAILVGYYLGIILKDGFKDKYLRKVFVVGSWLIAGLLVLGAVASVFATIKFKTMIPDPRPVFLFGVMLSWLSAGIVFCLRSKRYAPIILVQASISLTVLIVASMSKIDMEPWVSTSKVTQELKLIDQSNSTLIVSKFYARGVHYFTNRDVAVIDINGKGYFSPHPIPMLTKDSEVLNFLNNQLVTYGVVKKSQMEDLRRLSTGGNLNFSVVKKVGDKFIVKIEKIVL